MTQRRNGDPVGRAFISYTRSDEAWATWISWQLGQDGWKVDVQAWDVVPGANFVGWMHECLSRADHVVLVASQASLASGWVGAEWQSAYAPDERRVVPVRIEPVEADGLLARLDRIDLFGMDEDDARHRLLQRMRAARSGRDVLPTSSPRFPGAAPGRVPGPAPPDPPPFPGSELPAVPAAEPLAWPARRAGGEERSGPNHVQGHMPAIG